MPVSFMVVETYYFVLIDYVMEATKIENFRDVVLVQIVVGQLCKKMRRNCLLLVQLIKK